YVQAPIAGLRRVCDTATLQGKLQHHQPEGSLLICGARPSGRISIASKYTLKRAEARAPFPSQDTTKSAGGLTASRFTEAVPTRDPTDIFNKFHRFGKRFFKVSDRKAKIFSTSGRTNSRCAMKSKGTAYRTWSRASVPPSRGSNTCS